MDALSILAGTRSHAAPAAGFLIRRAESAADLAAYRALRHDEFVLGQHLFAHSDADDVDDDPRTVVLVATAPNGTVLGGVRLAPRCDPDLGWWTGSRLVTVEAARSSGVGPALVRAACAHAESAGVLRFEAAVQRRYAPMFTALGWEDHGDCPIAGRPHALMRWPLHQMQRLTDATKSFLGDALAPLRDVAGGLGPAGFVGDDGVPLPGSDVIAACDAIIPSMVERDPEWAGWCSVLVNVNDLTAMGAAPTGLLDAVGAPTRSLLTRIVRGIARASQAWRVPVLGGHTQLGVPASLAVTAFGRTTQPIRAGGGAVGDALRLTADLTGGWRPGQHGRQWDSSSARSADELAQLATLVARMAPRAAKDVSMAGVVGTAGMLAEASGTGAELDVARIPRPADAAMGAWLSCFPGYAMLTADRVGAVAPPAPPGVTTAACGLLSAEPGVRLRWPDGVATTAVSADVTGLGRA
ncbi:AIR synthase [Mycolicibacterium madagascariense]|uniref:AIR synthase n=1 Tax=Mycolicibacterium madagascariense TaxID=212765 RepID=A0A7I7XCV3_9MYCO|nr:MSMEG_0567/sll0787 family protein [Mycolicibacterium madagascariense]MCV7015685.1 AIR synthase [Mycolicibacterium madagascariense]BBZ27100.1 AIR synthase [Mycolicibacterium madagascariense]